MSWEKSRVLTPLKRDFLKRFFEKTQQFYLTGGSALGIFYLQHRFSYDLDLFTQDNVDWHRLRNLILDISREISAECETITASPDFYRFEISRGKEREIIDLIVENIPQIDNKKESFGQIRVDTFREIGVNKICTLISRCELKDLIDLYFMKQHGFDILAHFSEAQQKERGLDPGMLSFLLAKITCEELPDYLIADIDKESFNGFIRDLQMKMAELSFPI